MTAAAQVNCVPQQLLEIGGYEHCQKVAYKVGAENEHRRTQNSPQKHLCRTSPAQ